MPLPVFLLLVLLIPAVLAGCGGDSGDRATGSSGTATTATGTPVPALGRRPAAPGEIVVAGETSPETHGPYAFHGRYLVRFEQVAPEDPKRDFASQTPFTAALTRREDDPRGAIQLFQAARRSGRRELVIRGRYFVGVSFGDYPYVIRFTPRDG
jgi:hypothetical protein